MSPRLQTGLLGLHGLTAAILLAAAFPLPAEESAEDSAREAAVDAAITTATDAASAASEKTEGSVRIEGLRSVSNEEARGWIEAQIDFIESAGPSMARADDAAFFLETALRDRGYTEAKVSWDIEGSTVALAVDEGSPTVLGDIAVEGNEALSDEAVRELVTTPTVKRLGSEHEPGSPVPYVSSDVRSGVGSVESFYLLMGYPEATVDWETVPGSADVTGLALTVREGPRYLVGAIVLPEAPDASVAGSYDQIIEDFSGKSFSAAIPAKLASRLDALATEAGFYDAEVRVESSERAPGSSPPPGAHRLYATGEKDSRPGLRWPRFRMKAKPAESTKPAGSTGPDGETDSAGDAEPTTPGADRLVDLLVVADWGPTVPLSEMRVTGNEKVKTRFFERHFEKVVGQPYSPTRVSGRVNELLQTGTFESVRTETTRLEDGSMALDVIVEEGPSRELAVYTGFATWEGPLVGFEFRNLNLLGSARRADAHVEFSRRGMRGGLDYTDPWFLWTDWGFQAGLFAENRVNRGYEKFETGGRYELTRKFGRQERHNVGVFGRAGYTDVHEADIVPEALGDRTYFAHSAGLSYAFDRRDNPKAPRSGFIVQGSASIASSAIASEIEFLRLSGRLGYYIPVGEHTLRLSARAGVIDPGGDTDRIPIDLRHFNGGATTVRSFQERALGPRDPGGYPIGGEFYTVFNAEYEIPVGAVDGLSVVPFFDAGNLLPHAEDASLDDLRYAVGLGLRYQTPIGPLRLDYGHNPDQRPGEPDGTLHIGFGVAY